jgi:rubrerythrin
MNVYKYAMTMEKDGEKYYRDLSKKTDNTGLQNILKMLANEEIKHYQFLEQMSKNDLNTEFAETHILENVKNIFTDMREDMLKFHSSAIQTELYQKACDMEEESYNFYVEKSKIAENSTQKEIFLKLADMEKKHMILMENLVEFVSRPQTWIENAEFNHMDEY